MFQPDKRVHNFDWTATLIQGTIWFLNPPTNLLARIVGAQLGQFIHPLVEWGYQEVEDSCTRFGWFVAEWRRTNPTEVICLLGGDTAHWKGDTCFVDRREGWGVICDSGCLVWGIIPVSISLSIQGFF